MRLELLIKTSVIYGLNMNLQILNQYFKYEPRTIKYPKGF